MYVLNVSSILDVCCKCFHLDVAIVDLDFCIYMHVASVCFKCFRCFHTSVTSVSFRCCICLKYLSSAFSRCFASVSDVSCKCFNCFGRMLQVFYLGVSKVDLHTHVAMAPACHSDLLHQLGDVQTTRACYLCSAEPGGEKPSTSVGAHVLGRAKK